MAIATVPDSVQHIHCGQRGRLKRNGLDEREGNLPCRSDENPDCSHEQRASIHGCFRVRVQMPRPS